MTTELMFNAVWQDLETPQLVALLSCLVPCSEKNSQDEDAVRIPRTLEHAVTTLQSFARTISAITTVRIHHYSVVFPYMESVFVTQSSTIKASVCRSVV